MQIRKKEKCLILPTKQSCNMFWKTSCVFSFLHITISNKVLGPKLDTVLLLKPWFLFYCQQQPSANQPTENKIPARFTAGIITESLEKIPTGTAAFLGHNFTPLKTVFYYTVNSKGKTFKVSKCCFIEMVGILKREVSPGNLPVHTNEVSPWKLHDHTNVQMFFILFYFFPLWGMGLITKFFCATVLGEIWQLLLIIHFSPAFMVLIKHVITQLLKVLCGTRYVRTECYRGVCYPSSAEAAWVERWWPGCCYQG